MQIVPLFLSHCFCLPKKFLVMLVCKNLQRFQTSSARMSSLQRFVVFLRMSPGQRSHRCHQMWGVPSLRLRRFFGFGDLALGNSNQSLPPVGFFIHLNAQLWWIGKLLFILVFPVECFMYCAYIYIYIYIYIDCSLNISTSRERSVFSHIVRTRLNLQKTRARRARIPELHVN